MPRHKNGSTARPIEGGVKKRPGPPRVDGGRTDPKKLEERRSPHEGGYNLRGANPKPVLPAAVMPDRPCIGCGARGWCGHHGRIKPEE